MKKRHREREQEERGRERSMHLAFNYRTITEKPRKSFDSQHHSPCSLLLRFPTALVFSSKLG